MFFSRTEGKGEKEGGRETEERGRVESVYLPISRLLFEPEGKKTSENEMQLPGVRTVLKCTIPTCLPSNLI